MLWRCIDGSIDAAAKGDVGMSKVSGAREFDLLGDVF